MASFTLPPPETVPPPVPDCEDAGTGVAGSALILTGLDRCSKFMTGDPVENGDEIREVEDCAGDEAGPPLRVCALSDRCWTFWTRGSSSCDSGSGGILKSCSSWMDRNAGFARSSAMALLYLRYSLVSSKK